MTQRWHHQKEVLALQVIAPKQPTVVDLEPQVSYGVRRVVSEALKKISSQRLMKPVLEIVTVRSANSHFKLLICLFPDTNGAGCVQGFVFMITQHHSFSLSRADFGDLLPSLSGMISVVSGILQTRYGEGLAWHVTRHSNGPKNWKTPKYQRVATRYQDATSFCLSSRSSQQRL